MGTWTFYFGQCASRSKMRFDLTKMSNADLRKILNSPGEIRSLWEDQKGRARTRSRAAVQANVTRRIA
jgi:hypothetical protein